MASPIFGTTIPDAQDVPIDTTTNTVNPETDDVQLFIDAICAPDTSQKPTYLSNGEISFVEFFKGTTQTTPNRIARVDVFYTGDDPTTETWKLYSSSDGTTVLKTITFTHTWVSNDLTKSEMATV